MNQKEKFPHFLIAGTMKGGTTALYDFITLHPDIERATEKEIHYFSLNYHKGLEWYLDHFPKNSGKLIGEASPTYFDAANTPLIPNLIKTFNPDVKILIIVRDPIERAVSHYNHLCRVNKVSEVSSLDVDEFLTLPLSDAMAENTTVGFHLKQVLAFSFYYRKYLLYKNVFDRNNILVLSNISLREKPFETMRRVYDFIGVTPLEFDEFKKIKYSTGTNIRTLNSNTIDYLAELFYADYVKFCEASGIEHSEVRPRKKSTPQSTDVHAGKSGWLFLVGGSNNLIDYYKDPSLFTQGVIDAWVDLIKKRVEHFEKKNIQYVHLFVPNKLTIYSEYYDGTLEFFASSPLQKFYGYILERQEGKILDHIINPINYYQKLKKTYQLFWKTDTHWTFYGAYGAYQLICERLGVKANVDLIKRHRPKVNFVMDLGGKMDPPVSEEVVFFNLQKDSQRVYANELVRYKEQNKLENDANLHVGSNVIFKNNSSAIAKKVVLFGDSFSEYRPHLLTGTLAETFREVHFVWSTGLDFDYIGRVKPDIVITEIVERFMPKVPKDDFNLEKYTRSKLDILNGTGWSFFRNLRQFMKKRWRKGES